VLHSQQAAPPWEQQQQQALTSLRAALQRAALQQAALAWQQHQHQHQLQQQQALTSLLLIGRFSARRMLGLMCRELSGLGCAR
jgi:hypothetical protein